jgi:hypothetical protein
MLVSSFLEPPQFREHAIECLTEIASISLPIAVNAPEFQSYLEKVLGLNATLLNKLFTTIIPDRSIPTLCAMLDQG